MFHKRFTGLINVLPLKITCFKPTCSNVPLFLINPGSIDLLLSSSCSALHLLSSLQYRTPENLFKSLSGTKTLAAIIISSSFLQIDDKVSPSKDKKSILSKTTYNLMLIWILMMFHHLSLRFLSLYQRLYSSWLR